MSISNKYIISIVVPCYNCEATIDVTMKSLLGQEGPQDTAKSYQIVLVDDGSQDSTPGKCDEYGNNHSHVKVIHKANGGLVSAWKAGVCSADGEYIAFCDSDDYIDTDFIARMLPVIMEYHPDIITFGMMTEYDNGERVCNDTLLDPGMYDRKTIEEKLFPILLSNGDMQSELVGSSRCNKVFLRKLLLRIKEDVPENVSFGEDDITCFAAELNANSFYSIREYYPYHYVRNTASMIGAYDPHTFDKIDRLYNNLVKISAKYQFPYPNQVNREILSILFLFIKKEICKNKGGYRDIKKNILKVMDSDTYKEGYKDQTISQYKLPARVFARLISMKCIGAAYAIVKLSEGIRGRNV